MSKSLWIFLLLVSGALACYALVLALLWWRQEVSNGMDAPARNGIDVPKWKRYFNHLNRERRPP